MADNLILKWDPKSLEIRTITMEKTLEPLVLQVTTLVNTKCPSKLKKGKSKRASVLVSTVERATENFVKIGKLIAYENQDITHEMLCAVEEVRVTGLAMSTTSREFSEDPCSSLKRGNMVRAARGLLSAVTRLLIMADMADVHLLLKSLNTVENDFENLLHINQLEQLNSKIHSYKCNINNLMYLSAKRQQELIDPTHKEELAAARAVLKKHSTMLVTASKVYVNHPELTAAQSNRDYVFKQMCEAVRTINDVARGIRKQSQPHEEPGELATALDLFDKLIEMEPLDYIEITTRPSLEEQLENIISRAALMADSSSTRDERRERIVMQCNAVRQALQDLLTEYMNNMGKTIKSDNLITATDNLRRQTNALRRQLRKAVIDHISDCFVLTSEPLVQLIKSAQDGNQDQVEGYSTVFTEVSNKLIDVANMACSISNSEDGVKMVRYAAAQINQLYPEVISAARVLAARTRSIVAQDNMDAFHYAFEQQVRTLVEAVDDITAVDDFLAVTENHILEDVNKCIVAMQESDYDNLERNASGIIGRSTRICSMVTAEMDNYEPCVYTHRVLEAVKVLNKQIMPKFEQKISAAVTVLSTNGEIDEFDFVDSSRLVYDGLREIRRAVLMNRAYEDLDPEDVELDENYSLDTRSKSSADTGKQSVDEYPDIIGITTARDAMRKMPEEDRQKIMEHVEYFRSEKIKFDHEIAKWDDSGNDIIILAKHMCMILMEMTDFTRGRGPLKTTMDVINAARRISEAGTKLDKLTREIAEQCPESSTKNDLLAYLQRIALYCHQMNITSKVKADVQNISGELIVSGLDSATSLIESAKNLMSAVVLTVKASYVASTKYTRHGTVASSIVVWKMKVPEKKPLVRLDKPEETRAKVRKGTQQKLENHLQALCEFHSSSELV